MNRSLTFPDRQAQSYVLIGDTADRSDFTDEFRQFVRVLISGWKIVVVTIVAVMVLALGYIASTPPLYTARAQVLLDAHSRQVVSTEVVNTSVTASSQGPDTLLLDSQVEVILSQTILRKLIAKENLTGDPEFASAGLLTSLLGERAPASTNPVEDRVLTNLGSALRVKRETNTYLISIEFKTRDPEKSARLANSLAEIYIAEMSGAALATTENTAQALQSRLAALKDAASAAARKVEDYRRANGLIGSQNVPLVDQQLGDLNAQLASTRVALGAAEANLAQINAALKAPAGTAARTGGVRSDTLTQLLTQSNNLNVEYAGLKSRFGSLNPELAAIEEQRKVVLAEIDDEMRRMQAGMSADFENAKQREAAIQAQVASLQAEAAKANDSSVQLRELERDAESSQAVYDAFLKRSKEVWQQIELPSTSARVISKAFPPARPSEPKTTLLLAAAVIVGGLFGLGLVWVRHIMGSGNGETAAVAPRLVEMPTVYSPAEAAQADVAPRQKDARPPRRRVSPYEYRPQSHSGKPSRPPHPGMSR